MTRRLEKVYELLGTGTLPTTDVFGNATESFGNYTATGIDFWSLPGIITPMPHNGTFKRGPVSLFVSGARNSWWGAKLRSVSNPTLDVYSVSSAGSTLRYTSSVMPGMPRSFDFDIDASGHIIAVADIGQQLYAYYSFSSSLNWQLIASSAFTPRLLAVDNTCLLTFVDNNYTFSGSEHWFPQLHTRFANPTFPPTSSIYYLFGNTEEIPSVLPDSFAISPFTDLINVYWGWSGSISGTMSGDMTGSIKGHITGTLTGNVYGSVDVLPPSIFYGNLLGETTGVFGGTLVGDARVTGSFYGTLNGNFSGTYWTNTLGIMSFTQQPTFSSAPAGNRFFVGSMSGTLSGGINPYADSAVKPIHFINDLVGVNSNRIQLTHGRYDPISQNASYTTIVSHINVVPSGAGGNGDGVVLSHGVPFSMEVYQPTKITTPRFAGTDIVFSHFPGSQSMEGIPNFSADASTVGAFYLGSNDAGITYSMNYEATNVVPIFGTGYAYFNNTSQNGYPNQFVYVRVLPAGQGSHTGSVNPLLSGNAIMGIMFHSASAYEPIFDGTHYNWIADTTSGNLSRKWTEYTLVEFGPIQYIVSRSEGTDLGVGPTITHLTPGVKLRPILGDQVATVSITIRPDPASNFVLGNSGSTWIYYVSSSDQMLIVPVTRSIEYSTKVHPYIPTDVVGYAPAPYSKTWYPDVNLYLDWSASVTGLRYQTTMSTTSYLLSAV